MEFRWKRIGQAAAAGCALILGAQAALAQYAGPAMGTQTAGVTGSAAEMHLRYQDLKIMPGDDVAIETVGLPELTTTATTTPALPGVPGSSPVQGIKVGAQGDVELAYLGTVHLAGLTPSQASEYLETDLKEKGILTDPQVAVQLVDSPTRVITVVGQVEKPQQVPAFGPIRLLDVISACGGLTPLASHTVTIRRKGYAEPITVILGSNPEADDATNIPLIAGDTVIVSEVGDVFVVGLVKDPQAIPLTSNQPMTVLRAISMSGGVLYGAATSKVTILRTMPNHRRVRIRLDLRKVMDGKEQDVALMSDDVLLVPRNGFKSTISGGAASVIGGTATGVIYRLP